MQLVLLIRSTETRACRRSVTCFYPIETLLKELVGVFPCENLGITISVLRALGSRVFLTTNNLSNIRILESNGCQSTLISCRSFVIRTTETMRISINSVFHLQSSCISIHFLYKVLDRILVLPSSVLPGDICSGLFLFSWISLFFLFLLI